MLLGNFLNKVLEFKNVVKNDYLPFILMVLVFLLSSFYTLSTRLDNSIANIIITIKNSILFTIFFMVLGKAFSDVYNKNKFKKYINKVTINVVSIASGGLLYWILSLFKANFFSYIVIFGLLFTQIILILYFSNIKLKFKAFPYYFKNFIFIFIINLIITAGIYVCFLAFESLIYEFQNSYRINLILIKFIWIIIFGSMILWLFLKPKNEINIPNVFKIITLNIMLPIYTILLAILYLYLGKILIRLNFPVGKINWFVSFSSLLFIFFAFSLSQYKYENKFIDLFFKFGGLFLIPTIIVQFMSIYIRVFNYGLTILRYSSIMLNLFALIFSIILLVKREKGLNISLLLLSGIILISTISPINIVDLPFFVQSKMLEKLLINNNMLIDNKIVPNNEINLDEKKKIISSYRYLKSEFKFANFKPSFLNKDLVKKSEDEIFGFNLN